MILAFWIGSMFGAILTIIVVELHIGFKNTIFRFGPKGFQRLQQMAKISGAKDVGAVVCEALARYEESLCVNLQDDVR